MRNAGDSQSPHRCVPWPWRVDCVAIMGNYIFGVFIDRCRRLPSALAKNNRQRLWGVGGLHTLLGVRTPRGLDCVGYEFGENSCGGRFELRLGL